MSTSEPLVGHRPLVRADVRTPVVAVDDDGLAAVTIEVTNLDSVIRSFDTTILGLDPDWVTVDPAVVDLFPDESATVALAVVLPPAHPAGRRTVSVRVGVTDDTVLQPAVVDVVLELDTAAEISLTIEPGTLDIGGSGSFLLHLNNTGNTPLSPVLVAQDPERLVDVLFDPPHPLIQPGSRAVIRALARGPRPWVGLPVVRVLEVTATDDDASAIGAIALVQSPRISRRLLSFLGLLLVVSLFALVISLSFGRVATLQARNEALVVQGLGFDEPEGARVGPASTSGAITSRTGGGINGASVELYDQDDALRPVQTTVTDESGAFRFAAVPPGTYLLRTEVAGFGQAWFPGVQEVADAETFDVEAGVAAEDFDIQLGGQPGTVTGAVQGDDVAEAIVTVQLPATSIEGSDAATVPAVVQTVAVDATGVFTFGNLSTPSTYEIIVAKPGFAREVRTVTLRAGEDREDVEILIGRGVGIITGTVLDTTGASLPGVDIVASDGTADARTRSLSTDADIGTFELRDLTVPGTYTLTFTAPGFFPETSTITLGAADSGSLTVIMTADNGLISGTVSTPDGVGLGGITVTVVGADLERSTRSLSVGNAGSWLMDDLPVPGTYTVTFSSPTTTTTALSVELSTGADATRRDVDAELLRADATVAGRVTSVSTGDPISGVTITLEGSDLRRQTTSSDDPPGAYVLDGLPPGVYTLTYSRAGSAVQTRLVDLAPGEDALLEDVELEAQATIRGQVTRNGVGLANVGVAVYRSSRYPDDVEFFTVTDAQGNFEIVGLEAPETYVLDFQVPSGGEVTASEVVQLRPGDEEVVNVEA